MQQLRIPLSEPAADSTFRVLTPRVLTPDGRGSLIRFEKSALRELEWYVREGVKAINGHGIEVGGLVLGATLDWNAEEVVINGFVPVESEYLFGPTYRPSETDIAAFKDAAAGVEGTVVGYFRSQLRKDATVRVEDARLFAELFPASDCCFIPIHASENTPSTAGLYRVRPGVDPVLLDLFALKEHEHGPPLPGASTASTPSLVAGQPSLAAGAQYAGSPSGWADTSLLVWKDERRLKPAIWIPAALGTALLISAVAFSIGRWGVSNRAVQPVASVSTSTAVAPVSSKIDLHMIERGSQVEIRWNAADPAITSAARGKLIITDSPGQSIDLDSLQLHAGFYLYSPSNRSLNVLLMIHQKDGSFTGDSKMFVATRAGQLPRQTVSGLRAPEQPAIERSAKRSPEPKQTVARKQTPQNAASIRQASLRAVNTPAGSVSKTQAPVTSKTQAPATAKPNPVKVFALVLKNKALPEPTRVPAVLDPPAALPLAPSSGRSISFALPSVPAPPRPPAAPQTVNRNQPAKAIAPSRLLAPRLLHQAVPAVPLGVASRIRTEVRLDVSVSVDGDGKVVAAHLVATQGTAAGLLAIEVLKAAQMSRFLPAEQDGKAVPGTIVLTFRFAPSPT